MVCINKNVRFSRSYPQRAALNPARLAAARAQKEILNRNEAAAYLNIAPGTLTRYVKEGVIPCRKLARRVVFSREALRRWAEGEQPTQQSEKAPTAAPTEQTAAPIMETANAGSDLEGRNV